MSEASAEALAQMRKDRGDIDLVVPHQANLRIIEFVAKRAGVPMERVFVNVQQVRQHVLRDRTCRAGRGAGRRPGLAGQPAAMPAFGGGLTFCAHVVRWGDRVTPLATSEIDLPPCERSALDMAREHMSHRDPRAFGERVWRLPVGAASA